MDDCYRKFNPQTVAEIETLLFQSLKGKSFFAETPPLFHTFRDQPIFTLQPLSDGRAVGWAELKNPSYSNVNLIILRGTVTNYSNIEANNPRPLSYIANVFLLDSNAPSGTVSKFVSPMNLSCSNRPRSEIVYSSGGNFTGTDCTVSTLSRIIEPNTSLGIDANVIIPPGGAALVQLSTPPNVLVESDLQAQVSFVWFETRIKKTIECDC